MILITATTETTSCKDLSGLTLSPPSWSAAVLERWELTGNRTLQSSHRSESTVFIKAIMVQFARYKDGEGLPHIARPKVTKPSSLLLSRSRTDVALDAKHLYEQVPAANEDGAND